MLVYEENLQVPHSRKWFSEVIKIHKCLNHPFLQHSLQTLLMEKIVRMYYQHQLENYSLQATTDVDDIEENTSDVVKNLPSCYLLVDSDILKSIAKLLELVHNVRIS